MTGDEELSLTRAAARLGEAVAYLRLMSAQKGWDCAETHKALLAVEKAMLLWRIRRRGVLGLAGRTSEISDLEAVIVRLVEGT